MKKSRYFSDLFRSYLDEIDDLVTDSDGKTYLDFGSGIAVNALAPQSAIATPQLVAAGEVDADRFEPLETMAENDRRVESPSDTPSRVML